MARRIPKNTGGGVRNPNSLANLQAGSAPIDVRKLSPAHDTPFYLLKEIQEKRLNPRSITRDQRMALLMVMAHGKQTAAELGHFFGVSTTTIRGDVKELRQVLGTEIKSWTLEDVLGHLYAHAEKCSVEAAKAGDPGLVWTIQRDFVRSLKELGVIGTDTRESNLRITIEQLTESHQRTRTQLVKAMDPRLTGEVIDVEAVVKPTAPPPLALPHTAADAPAEAPQINIELPEPTDPSEQ